MPGILPTSALKAFVGSLADDAVIKKAGAKNKLLKAGIKQEELDYSGMEKALAEHPNESLTGRELKELEANRQDKFSSTQFQGRQGEYRDTTLGNKFEPSYTEDVRGYSHATDTDGVDIDLEPYRQEMADRFNKPNATDEEVINWFGLEAKAVKGRSVQSHFGKDVPDYMVHSRYTVAPVGDVPDTRLVQEIQSDLHQAGRKEGYQGGKKWGLTDEETGEPLGDYPSKALAEEARAEFFWPAAELKEFPGTATGVPDAPLKKNWSRKEIERQILGAVSQGQKAIAIPLEGAQFELSRDEGVQKWYETQVRGTLKKVAKQIPGAEYKEVTDSASKSLRSNVELEHLLENDDEVWDAMSTIIDMTDGAPAKNTRAVIEALGDERIMKNVPEHIKAKVIKQPLTYGQIVLPKSTSKQLPTSKKEIAEVAELKRKEVSLEDKIATHKKELAKPKAERIAGLSTAHHEERLAIAEQRLKQIKDAPSKITPQFEAPEWTKKFELYTAGGIATAALAAPEDAAAQEAHEAEENPIGNLLRQGELPTDVMEVLQLDQGMDEEQSRRAVLTSIQANINKLIGTEDPEDIQAAVEEKYGEFTAGEEFNYGEGTTDFPEEPMQGEGEPPELVPIGSFEEYANKSTEELYYANENVNFELSSLADAFKGVVYEDEGSMRKFIETSKRLEYTIANNLRHLGRNVEIDENGLYETDKYGVKTRIGDEFWASLGGGMAAAEYEIAASIAGATGGVAAARGAAQKVAKIIPGWPGKLASLALVGTGAIAGSAVTTPLGRGLDIAYNAYTEKEDIEASFYRKQMTETGIFEILAGPVLAAGAVVGKKLILSVGRGLKQLATGNKAGAREAMEQFTNLGSDEIDEIITKYEKVSVSPLEGDTAEKAFSAVAQTQPGAEELVSQASQYNPALTMQLARSIDTRAKDVIKMAENATPDNIGIVVKDELESYVGKVKDFYGATKKAGIANVPTEYKFDMEKLAIKPMLIETKNKISNKSIRKRVTLYLETVDALSVPRGFKDLIDLRRTMNEFKYNTKLRGYVDHETVNGVLKRIDNEIARTASNHMPDADNWLKQWKMTNTEYSKMLTTKKNVLYKALTKPGVDPATIVKSMSKHINSLDGTFMQVVGKLPARTRGHMEGAVLTHLTSKHTIGESIGLQAVNFPALNEELKHMAFASPKARNLKRGIGVLAEVFKNDPNLSRLSNTIHVEKAAQGLTADLRQKAKYSLMAKIWGRMQSYMPFSDNARFASLGIEVEKVLRNPSDTKSVDALLKLFPKDTSIADGVRQLALVTAKFGAPENYPYIKLHKLGAPSKAVKGKYGEGIYWSTDELGTKGAAGPEGRKVTTKEILPERIATAADIKRILGVEELDTSVIKASEGLQEKLQEAGYNGFAIGHDVLIFKE